MPAGAVHPYGYRLHCHCPLDVIDLRPVHLTQVESLRWWAELVRETAPKAHPLEVRP